MTDEMIDTIEEEKDPVDIINELKENSVSKDEFNKLKAQNTKLLNALAKGEKMTTEESKPVDRAKLVNELYGTDRKPLSNLEYATKTMELRDAIIAAGEPDPFLPNGHMITPTTEDITEANKLAEVFKECIDYAQGDDGVFTNELMRRTMDVRVKR